MGFKIPISYQSIPAEEGRRLVGRTWTSKVCWDSRSAGAQQITPTLIGDSLNAFLDRPN